MTRILRKSNKAFTMAEILLSLTIIGVVAAITLPSLTGNINERTWNTQRKALYARMSQAMALMPALNGLGTYNVETDSAGSTTVTDTAAQAFVTELGNVLKINNVCDQAHLEDCGIVSKFIPMGGNSEITTPTNLYSLNGWFSCVAFDDGAGFIASFSGVNTNAVAFETQNGESIVTYYNYNCKTEYLNELVANRWGDINGYPEANMCVNFIYDLNGKKGPNTVGKDIGFITVFNSIDSIVVAPVPTSAQNANDNNTINWYGASEKCTTQDPESRLPNINELNAMLINKDLINLSGPHIWSGSVYGAAKAWSVGLQEGLSGACDKSTSRRVRCVKR